MKKALIIGHTGQDGYYLTQFLEQEKYIVTGVSSKEIYNPGKYILPEIYTSEKAQEFISAIQPDEIYYLAAFHQSSTDAAIHDEVLFEKSFYTNTLGFVKVLQALVDLKLQSRVFYAASSHVFGLPEESPQTENTPFEPKNIYGISKVAAINAAKYYHETYGIYTSVGILYNHESPRRDIKFVTQKIIHSAILIKQGKLDKLELGNMSARIDWGFAPDYVKAFHAVLKPEDGDIYIIATGVLRTVQEFVDETFGQLGLESKKFAREQEGIITKKLNGNLCGNIEKIYQRTGWKPQTSFSEMIRLMLVEAEAKLM